MATQAKMNKVFGDANTVKAMLERQSDQVKSLTARSASNVAAHAASVLAIRSAFPGLHGVRRMPVATGDGHGPTVFDAQSLETFHEVGKHPIQA
jgi:hypothetical protein